MDLTIQWTKQNPDFNTYKDDVFPSIVSSPNGIYGIYQTNGRVKNGIRFKGGYDIALFESSPDGSIQFIHQNPDWNTSGKTRLSYQSIATYGNFIYFTYWTNQPIEGQQQTGKYDIVVCKTDASGTIHWIQQENLPNTDGWNTWPCITTDQQGNVIVAFTTTGLITEDGNAQRVGREVDSNIVIFKVDAQGQLVWARQRAQLNSTKGSATRPSIVCDKDDDVYIGYACTGALPNKKKTTITSSDIVLAKLSAFDGAELWVKQDDDLNTPLTNTAPILTINPQNDLFVAYSTSGVVEEKSVHYQTGRKGHTDVVVARLSSNDGSVIWLRQRQEYNSISNDTPFGIVSDTENNVYVSFTVSIMDILQRKVLREDMAILRLSTYGDMEILKYDNTLNYQEYSYRHTTPKIAIFQGEVYTAYSFTNFLQESVYNQEFNDTIFETQSDIVLKKFELIQTVEEFLIWTKQDSAMNTTKRDLFPSVAVDFSNDIVTMYQTDGAIQGYTNNGSYDIALFKTDSSGSILWTKQASEWNTRGKATVSKKSLAIDSQNNIVFAYSTKRWPIQGQYQKGVEDIVLVKVDPQGELLWVHQDILPNTVSSNIQPSIAIDSNDHIVVAFLTDGQVESGKAGLAGQAGHVPTKVGGAYHKNLVVFRFDHEYEAVQWCRQEPLLNSVHGSIGQVDVIITANNEIVLSYVTSGALPDMSKCTHTSTDIVVAKLDDTGAILWRKQDTEINSILTNTAPYLGLSQEGDILIAYSSSGTFDGSGNGYRGDTEVLVGKLDGDTGSKQWLYQMENWNTARQDTPYSMITDGVGNIYVSYTTFRATIDNRPSEREDVALLKLDKDGHFEFAQQDKSLNHRLGDYRHTAPKMALDLCGNVVIVYGFTRFQISNYNILELDRGFRKRGFAVRSIEYNHEGDNAAVNSGDSDIVLIKVSGDGGGKGGANTSGTNDGTGVEEGEGVAIPEEDPTVPVKVEPTITATGCVVRIPIVLDASYDATMYGEEEPDYDYSYNIRMNTATMNSNLLSTFLQYVKIQESDIESEGTFHFTYNPFAEEDIRTSLQSDFKYQKGRVKNKVNNLQQFESGHTVQDGTLGELFVRYFADVLFNHPEAQAPIRNDAEIIRQVDEDSLLYEQFISKITSGLLDRVNYVGSDEEQQSTSKNPYLRSVLEQMFLKVPERFIQHGEDNIPVSLPFQPGDEVSFLVRMRGRMELDELQDYSTVGNGSFKQPITNFFLENTIKDWKLDPSNIREDAPAFLVTKMWKLTLILT